jgi:hypothetical protein
VVDFQRRRKRSQASQATAISRALQIWCIRSSLSAAETLDECSEGDARDPVRLTTDARGMGSSPGSSSTSLGIPRIVVLHGPTSARRSRGIAASRDRTTTGRRPTSASSHHHTSPRGGNAVRMPRPPPGTRQGLPTRLPRRPGACRTPCKRRRSRLRGGARRGGERLVEERRICQLRARLSRTREQPLVDGGADPHSRHALLSASMPQRTPSAPERHMTRRKRSVHPESGCTAKRLSSSTRSSSRSLPSGRNRKNR